MTHDKKRVLRELTATEMRQAGGGNGWKLETVLVSSYQTSGPSTAGAGSDNEWRYVSVRRYS